MPLIIIFAMQSIFGSTNGNTSEMVNDFALVGQYPDNFPSVIRFYKRIFLISHAVSMIKKLYYSN